MKSGVYEILNVENGKLYIGSSIDIEHRLCQHRQRLLAGGHHNRHLQASWAKYGPGAFVFFPVEYCETAAILEKEQFWITAAKATDRRRGYNICPTAGNTLGNKHTEAAKRKISEARVGRKLSEDHIRKLREANKGKVVSAATREKMAVASKGKKHSAETRKKISESAKGHTRWVGRKHTEESKRKISEAKVGHTYPRGVEHHNFGRKHTEETKKKLAEIVRGRKHSEATRQKMRDSHARRKARLAAEALENE